MAGSTETKVEAKPENGKAKPAGTLYAEKLAKMRAARLPAEQAAEEARRARDVAELDAVFEALSGIEGASWDDNVVHLNDTPPNLPGHLVLKRPQPSATKQFKQRLLAGTKLDADRGASERRVEANKVYVLNCLAYPSHDRYEELCGFAAGIPESAVKLVHRLADAGAQDDVKE